MKKIAVIIGTRPEAIKLAPVVKKLKSCSRFYVSVILTAQHRELVDEVLDLFDIIPDYDLDLMKTEQEPSEMVEWIIKSITPILKDTRPDILLVQGDTVSAFASAFAAFLMKIPVGHIEAGLRSYNKYLPFPEEISRRLLSVLADVHFAPTEDNRENLLKEGIPAEKVFVTGNTVIDAMNYLKKEISRDPSDIVPRDRFILVTAHRRENWGTPLVNICTALKRIRDAFSDIEIVYPVHPNPRVRETVYTLLKEEERITLLRALNYKQFLSLLARCYLVLTDSGGIQEEAPVFGKPVLVLREKTERPELIKSGLGRLVGTDVGKIIEQVKRLLKDPKMYENKAKVRNIYGDGMASDRIARILDEIDC